MSELPKGWAETTLGAIRIDDSEGINPARFPGEDFELYSVPSHATGDPEIVSGASIGSNKQTVRDNTVLLCKINPRINRVWVVEPRTSLRRIASTEWIAFSPKPGMLPDYLAYYLRQTTVRDYLAQHASGVGGSLMRVKPSTFSSFPFFLAPWNEQCRIVDEIEKQFTRLDAATAALKRVQANLKRYRASVLKAACEGRLVPTEAELARKEGRDYEPADKLLQRILRERRARWEADTLAKMHASGKPPKDDHWKQKYSIPEPPDNTGLGGLPEGWSWASPDQLSAADDNAICAGPFGTIFKAKDFRSEGVPIIFLRHVSAGRYVTHKPGFMDLQIWEELFRPYSVFGGELLITKLGDPPGVCAIYPEDSGPAMVTPDVIKMSVNASGVQARYLMHYINSDQARQFSTGACFGTTRLRLTLPIFRTIPVALPPISEQVRIADEIDRHLSNADALSNSAVSQLLRTTALRQSVLRSAFTGQLVPQDPSDEPAAALLERIRAERANQSRHTAALNAKQKPRTARQRGAK